MASRSVEVDPDSFRRDAVSWDGRSPSFGHLVLTAMVQCLLYGSGSILMAAVAGEFGYRLDDVRSWALGLSEPPLPVQRRVVAALARHVDETVAVYLKFHDRLPAASSAAFAVGKAAG